VTTLGQKSGRGSFGTAPSVNFLDLLHHPTGFNGYIHVKSPVDVLRINASK
jgi:hypothetical protein